VEDYPSAGESHLPLRYLVAMQSPKYKLLGRYRTPKVRVGQRIGGLCSPTTESGKMASNAPDARLPRVRR
jgi:hypothetical protein